MEIEYLIKNYRFELLTDLIINIDDYTKLEEKYKNIIKVPFDDPEYIFFLCSKIDDILKENVYSKDQLEKFYQMLIYTLLSNDKKISISLLSIQLEILSFMMPIPSDDFYLEDSSIKRTEDCFDKLQINEKRKKELNKSLFFDLEFLDILCLNDRDFEIKLEELKTRKSNKFIFYSIKKLFYKIPKVLNEKKYKRRITKILDIEKNKIFHESRTEIEILENKIKNITEENENIRFNPYSLKKYYNNLFRDYVLTTNSGIKEEYLQNFLSYDFIESLCQFIDSEQYIDYPKNYLERLCRILDGYEEEDRINKIKIDLETRTCESNFYMKQVCIKLNEQIIFDIIRNENIEEIIKYTLETDLKHCEFLIGKTDFIVPNCFVGSLKRFLIECPGMFDNIFILNRAKEVLKNLIEEEDYRKDADFTLKMIKNIQTYKDKE